MTLLDSVHGPADLKRMGHGQLQQLAGEIRDFLIDRVRRSGGHLGPNLGVVELTMALHRVFDSPRDAIVFDVGHQSYVHKIVTGRHDGFGRLRQSGGVAGYPIRSESEHDLVENSHASTALSYVDGLAKAFELAGGGRHAVAVVGDGALMFSIQEFQTAVEQGLDLTIVCVDNGGYGGIRAELSRRGDSEATADLASVDFCALAAAVGCHGVRTSDPETLVTAFEAAFSADRPTLNPVEEREYG